jgi:hypothetical protein
VTDVVELKRRCKHIRLDGADERIMRDVGHCRHIVRVGYKGEKKGYKKTKGTISDQVSMIARQCKTPYSLLARDRPTPPRRTVPRKCRKQNEKKRMKRMKREMTYEHSIDIVVSADKVVQKEQ